MTLRLPIRAAAVPVALLAAAVLLGAGGGRAATSSTSVGLLDHAPLATDAGVVVVFGTPTPLTLVAIDVDGDPLAFAIVSPPAHGSLGPVVGNSVTYTPDRNFLGADSFTFKANDGTLDSNVATVALTVGYVNQAPVADNGVAVTDANTPEELTLGASDPDADGLTFAIVTPPVHGTLGPIADEKVTYTPAPGYQGVDSFTFKASDGSLESNLATVVLTIAPANHAPVATDGSAATAGGMAKQLTLGASDPDRNLLTYSIVSGPSHGTLGLLLGNSVLYTPAPGFEGLDFFTFKASDGSLDSNTATVAVATTGTQDPSQALAPTFTPVADAYVNQLHPGSSYGSSTKLYTDGSPLVRGYLRFNVSGLDGYRVTSAILRVYLQNSGASGQVLDVHGVSDSSWGETKITYSNAPAFGATIGSSGSLSGGSWASIDVTPLVNGNGLVSLAVTTASGTNVRYSSREGANAPQLAVVGYPDSQPPLPLRAAFYYPSYPEAWTQNGIFPYTHYHPTLGFYDSGASAVVQQHVAAMQYGGIQTALASWAGVASKTDGRFATLLSTTDAAGSAFRWAVLYELEGQANPTVAQIESDLISIRRRYGGDPSYLRIAGRFVVFVSADASDGCAMPDRWKQANTPGAYVVLRVVSGYTLCASQPSGWYGYAPAGAENSQGTYSFSISPGFWRADESTPRVARDLTRWKTNIANMAASGARFQLVTSFNQWSDGTAVESATEWATASGYGAYLDALRASGGGSGATSTPPSNASPPTISGSARQGQTLTASNGSWSGSTPMSFAYQWRRCDSAGGSCASIAGATAQTYTLAAADVGFTVRVVVTATNSAGSSAATSAQTAVVAAATDTQPPTTPSGLSVSGATKDSLTLSWNASTDDKAVAGYSVYANGAKITTTTALSYTFSGLACGTSHTLGVDAFDAAGNVSGRATASGSTLACVAPPPGTGWRLAFDDEFDGTTLDTGKWHTCFWWATDTCSIESNNELELYTRDEVSVQNGYLRLRAEKRDMVGWNGKLYHYTSGMVMTGGRKDVIPPGFTFTYGYMEARVRVPAGKGLWPAFWTLPASYTYPPEIDMTEILGDSTTVTHMHYHYSGTDVGSTWTGPDFSTGWHTFAADWEPGQIIWYVDGVERFRYTNSSTVTSSPMYVLLNLAVGGDWPGAPDASTVFPAYYDVDFVRIWQK
jgi:beta-glucanase (GH16 family)